MRILTIKHFVALPILLCFSTSVMVGQQAQTSVKQDEKFEQLLNEKRKINSSIVANERYKIQVYVGNSDGARKVLYDCKQEFSDLDGTINFFTPNYKVWIGSFRTRLEAIRYSLDIKRKYPNMLIIKPQ